MLNSFDRQCDKDAAVKFSLYLLIENGRFDDLNNLLIDGHKIGGVEGVPGWIIERRDSGDLGDMPGYSEWPNGAVFRAFVDPMEITLGVSEVFMDRHTFHTQVTQAIKLYIQINPENGKYFDRIIELIRENSKTRDQDS